jgi:AcrR family transcriptional regulator
MSRPVQSEPATTAKPGAVRERAHRRPRGDGDRAAATQKVILDTAERLFAEHGVYVVSNRQISEAAGQGNNAVVGYHFGTKADLVLAVVRRFTLEVEESRQEMLRQVSGSTELRDWVACAVYPYSEHLARHAPPTWFYRFAAQVMTDPGLRDIMVAEASASPSIREVWVGLARCLSHLPRRIRAQRDDMASHAIVHACAERERILAEGEPIAQRTDDWASGLIDALVGLWSAPVTRARR